MTKVSKSVVQHIDLERPHISKRQHAEKVTEFEKNHEIHHRSEPRMIESSDGKTIIQDFLCTPLEQLPENKSDEQILKDVKATLKNHQNGQYNTSDDVIEHLKQTVGTF